MESPQSLPPVSTKAEPLSDQEVDELDEDYESNSEDEDPSVFKIRKRLDEPEHRLLTTSKLHRLIHESFIDLDPPYQRDVVWTENKQMYLIDSLFHGKYVPPVLFAVREDQGEEVRVCVDGKQRLTSIQKFLDGQIPYRCPRTKRLWYFTHKDESKVIPREEKDKFLNKKIVCMEYKDLTNADERDIFQRVQLGVTLSAAEKLQAISSPWSDWISTLEAKHVSVDNGLATKMNWDTKRGRNFQNLAYMIHCCDGYPEAKYVPTGAKMEKWLSRLDSPSENFKSTIEQTLNDLWGIATNKELNYGLHKIASRLAPIEFIFIGVLLYVTRNKSLQFRAGAITLFREKLRAAHKDIRANSRVSKTGWEIIESIAAGNKSEYTVSAVTAKSRGKRRKDDDDDEDDDDDDYRPAPVTSLGRPTKTRSRKKT